MRLSVSGTLNVHDLRLDKGDEFIVTSNLTVVSSGDVTIDGEIRFDRGQYDNGGITLHSTRGNIVVTGKIQGAPGNSAPNVSSDKTSGCSATGQPGMPGSDITLLSDKGYIAIDGGFIRGGSGGYGSNTTASGDCSLVKAESGRGGRGGNIAVTAYRFVEVQSGSTLKGGDGYPGGTATATGDNDKTVEAIALGGGNGGDANLGLNPNSTGYIQLDGSIIGGVGGHTAAATASAGYAVTAEVRQAGRGGNVTVAITSLQRVTGFGKEVVGGDAGNCQGTASATATNNTGARATAKSGPGGDAGEVNVPVLGPSNHAGDSSESIARAQGATKTDNGKPHHGTTPGKMSQAMAP
jgi:hypothetical protein